MPPILICPLDRLPLRSRFSSSFPPSIPLSSLWVTRRSSGVAATAKHLSPTVRIIGVQAEQAPSYFLSWMHGHAVPTETCNTIADGLSTRIHEPDNVRAICELVDEVVLVTDDQMLAAIRHLALDEHIIAEPAGAAATAALLHAKFQCGRHTVLLVTGANISPEVLRAAICGADPLSVQTKKKTNE